MDWDKLQYFLFLARHGTLARAGMALHVDATTVSRRVSALETVLGQTLFERTPAGFVLTAAGRALVPHAEAMAALLWFTCTPWSRRRRTARLRLSGFIPSRPAISALS